MQIQLADGVTLPAMVGGLVAFLVSVLTVLTKSWHGCMTNDTHCGIQKFHLDPTPRIGGLALAIAAGCALVVAQEDVSIFSAQGSFHGLLWPLHLPSGCWKT